MPARFLLLLLLLPRHASGITLTWPSSFTGGYSYSGTVGTTSSLSFVISLPRLSPGQAASIGPMSLTIRCLDCDRFLANAGPQMTLSASQSDSCNALGGQQNTALHRCSPSLPFSTSGVSSYTFTVTNNNVLGSFDFTLGMTQTCSDASAITIACVTPTPSTTSTVTPSSSATSTSTRSGSSTVSRSSSSTRSATSTGTPSMTRTRSITPSSTATSTVSRSSSGTSTSSSSSTGSMTGSSTSTSSTTSTQSSTSSLTSTSSSSWSAGASASGTSTASLTSSSSSTQSTTSTSTATSSRSSTSSSSSSSSRTSSSSSTSSSTPSATGSSSSSRSATSTSYMTSAASFLPSISTATAPLYLSTLVDVSAVSARPQSAPDTLPTPTDILCTLQVALAQGVGVSVGAVRFSAPQPAYFNLPSPLSTAHCEAALMSLNLTTARRLELQGSPRCAAVSVSAPCMSEWLPLPMNRSVLYQSRIMRLIDLTHSNTTPTALAALLCTAFSLHALAPTRVQAEPLATLSDRTGVDVYLSYALTGTADGLTCVQAAAADWVLMPVNDVIYMPPSSGNSSSSSGQALLLLRALSTPVGISTSVLAAIIASTLLVALTCAVIGGRRRYRAKLKEYRAQQLVWGRGGSDPRIDGVADAAMSGCAVAADTLGGLYDSTRWMQVNPISKTRADRQVSHNDAEVERRLRLVWYAARTSDKRQCPQRPHVGGGGDDPVSHCETVLRDCIAKAMSSAAVKVDAEAAATCVAVAGDAACAHLLQERLHESSVSRSLATSGTESSKASAVTARPLRTSVHVGVRAALDAPRQAENLPDSHTGARVSMDAVMTAIAVQVERVVLQPGCHDDAETATSVSTLPAASTAAASSLVSMLVSGLRARPQAGAESDVGDTFADLLECVAQESSVDAGVYDDRHNTGSLEGMRVDASASFPAESGCVSAVPGARSSRAEQRSLVAASKLAHALPLLALPKPVLASTLLGVSKRVAAEALKVSDANRALRLRSAVTPIMVQRAVSSCVAALVEADIVSVGGGSELVVSAAAQTRARAQLAEHEPTASSSTVQGILDARARATRAVLTTPWHASSPAALVPPSFNACVVEEVVSWLQSKPGTQKDKARFRPLPSRQAADSVTARRSSLHKKERKLPAGDTSVLLVNPLVSSRTQAAGAGSRAAVNDGDHHEKGASPLLLANSTRATQRQLKSTRSLVSAAGDQLAEAAGAVRSDSLTRRGSSRRLFTTAHVDRPQSRMKQQRRVMMIRGDNAEDVGTDSSLPEVGSSMRRVGFIR